MMLGGESTRILVLSYTNHALDQFLEDLLKIGITSNDMIRLGSKSTAITADLSFETRFRRSNTRQSTEALIRLFHNRQGMHDAREEMQKALSLAFSPVKLIDVLEQLRFAEDDQDVLCWRAFQVPTRSDGFTTAGRDGKSIKEDYLISRWNQGKDPGLFHWLIDDEYGPVWAVPGSQRKKQMQGWINAVQEERLETLKNLIDRSNEAHEETEALFNEAKCSFVSKKRVIGCTTTAAAKYFNLIKAAKPSLVLVEEAGEIQESHILTALSPETTQLVLIGDHKQLRPKCNNYALSVEKDDGYDLNRSMFERLILQGHHHVTLRNQHRMDPEISQLVRAMTYPELLDAEKTNGRPQIRGIDGRVTFINHDRMETAVSEIHDLRDGGHKASKENRFEAEMILKIVKYLGQQGYKTTNMVVLTPYLGQLRLLRDMLSKENDPLLSDLDSFELIRVGLITSAAAHVERGRIRLSTIGEPRDYS